MNEAIENEIYEIEEVIASLSAHREDGSNVEIIAELQVYLMRLRNKLNSRCEELQNEPRPLSVGGEV